MNWTKRFLLTCLLAFTPILGVAQTLVNCAPATPCTMAGPSNTNTGDRAWLAFGKINTDLLVLAPLFNSTGLPFTLPVTSGGTGTTTLAGLIKGNGTSAFSAAASVDVISRWSGTCNATTFLRADGSCQAAAAGDPTAATYAAARLLTGVSTGDRLVVLGRTAQSDGGQGLFTWTAGGTTTVDDGYVLQATGGTWQRVDPSPTTGETLLNAVWYNIKPSNADTVNDTGFAKLKAQMQTSGTVTWHLVFPPGAYTYTNNRWLFGVQRVVIEAYGSSFQCTSTDPNTSNGIPLFNGDPFDDSGDTPWPHVTYANGYLFNTAAAGANSITTTTHADAGNFTSGMRVLLSGYDQQGSGYPPNMRYFDYKTVLTAVAGTGVVTFTGALQFAYDSRWWDTANYASSGKAYGAPRIISLERANYKRAQSIWLKGMSFLGNPTTVLSSNLELTGDLLIYEDVTAPAYTIPLVGTQIMRRCKTASVGAGDQSAGDKLVDRLIIEDSTFDVGTSGVNASLVDCVGCNSLALVRSKFFGGIRQIAPRSLLLQDCDVTPLAADFSGISTAAINPIRAVTIANTRIYNTGSLGYGFTNQASPGLALTVGTVVGTDIRIPFDATGKLVAYEIDYGMTLTNTVTGNTGIITAIYYETGSPGTLRIAGTWSAPTAGDVFHYYDVMQVSDGGGNSIVGAQVPFYRGPPGLTYQDGSINSLTFTTALINGLKPNNQIQPKTYGLQVVDESGVNVGYFGGGAYNVQNGAAINFALGAGVQYSEGTNGLMGLATLVGGTVTVSTTKASTANSRIFLSRHTTGGTTGNLSYTISSGVSFTITSTSGTETSTIDWLIINKQ